MTDIIARRSFCEQAVPASIEKIHELLDQLWNAAPCVPDMDRITFATAVIEAASNIVQHARPESLEPVQLGVEITVKAGHLHAEISAIGALDPMLDMDTFTMPGAEAESGRGLPLIQALVTTFTFSRQGSTNLWVLSRDSTPH